LPYPSTKRKSVAGPPKKDVFRQFGQTGPALGKSGFSSTIFGKWWMKTSPDGDGAQCRPTQLREIDQVSDRRHPWLPACARRPKFGRFMQSACAACLRRCLAHSARSHAQSVVLVRSPSWSAARTMWTLSDVCCAWAGTCMMSLHLHVLVRHLGLRRCLASDRTAPFQASLADDGVCMTIHYVQRTCLHALAADRVLCAAEKATWAAPDQSAHCEAGAEQKQRQAMEKKPCFHRHT